MEKIKSKLTVFFEEPFWIAIYECEYGKKYEICKITFGSEPKDSEIYNFFLKNCFSLKFTPSVEIAIKPEKSINPKLINKIAKKLIV